jgi:hypothetical protein
MNQFEPALPPPLPSLDECEFYHSIDLPDGESLKGHWDIRGGFEQYIGNYPLSGKTVLDVGTASGFLAFAAEAAGASVVALEANGGLEFNRVPFQDAAAHRDRLAWANAFDADSHRPMVNSFWYAWHKLHSAVPLVFAPVESLDLWQTRFDVVLAGAIIEHLSDPVSAIGRLARITDEAVIIAFTEVADTDELAMYPINGWTQPALDYVWWKLSRGLYRRVFDNLGFDVEFVDSVATYNPNRHNPRSVPEVWARKTILARRRGSGASPARAS